MQYKTFLNNPRRQWPNPTKVWFVINNKWSHFYNPLGPSLTWTQVDKLLTDKYGPQYLEDKNKGPVNITTNLQEDPLANETGYQDVAF